jgi:hypothetical protein
MKIREFKCIYKNWEDKPIINDFTVGKQYIIYRIYYENDEEKYYIDWIIDDRKNNRMFRNYWKWNFVPLSLIRKWKLKELNKLNNDI